MDSNFEGPSGRKQQQISKRDAVHQTCATYLATGRAEDMTPDQLNQLYRSARVWAGKRHGFKPSTIDDCMLSYGEVVVCGDNEALAAVICGLGGREACNFQMVLSGLMALHQNIKRRLTVPAMS